MNEVLHTKFGKAKRYDNHDGYYIIITKKEGNDKRKLHHLIWEDFYGCEIPDGYIIHHKNHNKLDNCILNLQLIKPSEHAALHNQNRSKHYATVVKKGSTSSGKQIYGINFSGKVIWGMTDKKKLINRFCAEYPLEIIKR
jgi:hypothetical protein